MSFMQLQSEFMTAYEVECSDGGSYIVPLDVHPGAVNPDDLSDYVPSEPVTYDIVEGWFARYSAPGYLDCTDWVGPKDTESAARKLCVEVYGEEDE